MMRWLTNLIAGGRVTLTDDTGDLQKLQITEGAIGTGMEDRIVDGVRRLAEFGFASVPPLDSEVVMIRQGGDRGQSIVIATNHRASRMKNLKPGDAAIHDVRGARVILTEAGIEISCAGLPLVIKQASKVRIEADLLEVTGDIVSRADGTKVSLNALRDAYAAHKHLGVQPGTGVSGLTDHDA